MGTPKVNVVETPSQQVLARAVAGVEVADAGGRKITLKKPGVLAQYRLIEILGDSAKNETYVGMCLPLLFVSAIDGEAVFAPLKKSEVEALIQRLDDAGITAVMNGVQKHFGGVRDREADREAIKK